MEDKTINYQKYNLGSAEIYLSDCTYGDKTVKFISRNERELIDKIQKYGSRSLATRVVDKLLKPSREFSSFFIKKFGKCAEEKVEIQTNKQTNNSLISCSIA